MKPYALLARLLAYPDDALLADRPALAAAAASASPRRARRALERFLGGLADAEPGALRREYVETFDFDRRASLHLTFHSEGDRRRRGLELARLRRRLAAAGFEPDGGELPDYLPLLLELAALVPGPEGTAPLAALRGPVELVRGRLHERGSRYADLVDAVAATLPALTRAEERAVRRLAEEPPPAELVGLEPGPAPVGSPS